MKRVILVIVSVVLFSVISFSFLNSTALNDGSEINQEKSSPSNTDTENMANVLDDKNNALSLRLSQLLGLSRIFDGCVNEDTVLVDEASVVLLKDAETDEYMNTIIKQSSVLSFIYDLYGKTIDVSALPSEYTEGVPEGYFYVIPRGYDTFTQTITDISIADNGQIVVMSDLAMDTHEGDICTGKVKTVFVKNEASAFGYNIISSEILSFQYPGEEEDFTSSQSLDLNGSFDTICLY